MCANVPGFCALAGMRSALEFPTIPASTSHRTQKILEDMAAASGVPQSPPRPPVPHLRLPTQPMGGAHGAGAGAGSAARTHPHLGPLLEDSARRGAQSARHAEQLTRAATSRGASTARPVLRSPIRRPPGAGTYALVGAEGVGE